PETVEVNEVERVTTSFNSFITESVKLRFWLAKKKTAAAALVKLKLDRSVDGALASPKLNTLSNYVDMFSKKCPNGQASLLGARTAKYGEIGVAKGLVTAKRVTSSKDIATKLQTQQLEGWLSNQRSVKDVFTILKISDNDILFVLSRKLDTLDEYIKVFNAKNPQHKKDFYTALRDGVGGEDKFALLVSRSMDFPETGAQASKYMKILFRQ
ncbi:hypothetical protein JG688_00016340, partial [Phytophthora aleatoria]